MTNKAEVKHPFGQLLTQYRTRKPGLTQTRLAELAGYDQAIVVRMAQGKKDLTGPSGPERVVRLIEMLADQGVLIKLDEANALLLAANLPPLFEKQPAEARLMTRFLQSPSSHRVRRTNLPVPLSSFIGRAAENAHVRRLLLETRLLTLTGSGGCGKTRLAQRVAADVLIHYPDGVWFVELAVLNDATSIADAVARIFGLASNDRAVLDQLAGFLRERHTLLVLDNCEHLIDAVAAFAARLLGECARLTVLTTSREALNVDGERTWRVPPLQPDEANRLFVERAVAVREEIALSVHDEQVGYICQRLDGMPLAIELAAARLQSLSLSDITARLNDRFSLLAQGKRGAVPRHQTLRAVIDWSFDLLSEKEKIIFRRLGVFVGGWELEQAVQVVALEPDAEAVDVVSLLTLLVAKSLVTVDASQAGNRFYFLETIREYAQEKLAASNEMSAMHDRHAEVFARQVGISARIIAGRDQKAKLDRIQKDYGNLESALSWSFSSGSTWIGCSLVSGLVSFWGMRTRLTKHARRWTQVAKDALSSEMPLQVQAGVWMAVTVFLSSAETTLYDAQQVLRFYELAGDLEGIALGKTRVSQCLFWSNLNKAQGKRMLQESLALAQDIGENGAWLVRLGSYCLGEFAAYEGQFEQAESHYYESLRQYQSVGDLSGVGDVLFALSSMAMRRLHLDVAATLTEEALLASRELEDVFMEVGLRLQLAEILRLMGDCQRANICAMEALRFVRENTDDFQCAHAMIVAAKIAMGLNHPDDAVASFYAGLELLSRAKGVESEIGIGAIAGLAWCADWSRQWKRCACLMGVMMKLQSSLPNLRPNPLDLDTTACIAKARAALGDAAYDAAYTKGRATTLEQAIHYALSQSDEGDQ